MLWKGFGKRKVRKSQRQRPAGWHGSHPAQKPLKHERETLDDLPIWPPPAKTYEFSSGYMGYEEEVSDDEREQQIIDGLMGHQEDFAEMFGDNIE